MPTTDPAATPMGDTSPAAPEAAPAPEATPEPMVAPAPEATPTPVPEAAPAPREESHNTTSPLSYPVIHQKINLLLQAFLCSNDVRTIFFN